MLPPVVDEGEIFPFKFWFNDSIQDGISYRSELYYRLRTVPYKQRARLYHFACKMAQRDRVLVTTSSTTCSLWMSLRSPSARSLQKPPFPFDSPS
ncbi:MAG TPA: hypothetical protein IGS37_09385 [Synechococcales cyanobacterium M55_K2018_004]|nr:hypothetical protein [Synechococcales cyanobacterium M55_K2018_004]